MESTTTRLEGPLLARARTIWGIVVAISLVLIVVTFPAYIQGINDLFTSLGNVTVPGWQIPLYLAVRLIYVLLLLIIGLLIGIRRSDDRVGLLVSGTLVTYALGFVIPLSLTTPTNILFIMM